MFSKYNSPVKNSLNFLFNRKFASFKAAKLDHTFIPCKSQVPTEAPNLIALHGVLGSGMNFNQIAHKSEISSKVNSYLLDLRNHGKSEHKDSMSYPEMAKDVQQFILDNGLENKQNILLGFSMGARVAMEVAVTYPELIKGVTLVDLAPHDYTADKNFTFVEAMNKTLEKLCQVDLNQERSKIRKDILAAAFDPAAGEAINSSVIPDGNGGYKWRLNIHSIFKNFLSQILNAKYNGYDTYDGPVKIIFGGASEYTSKDLINSYHYLFNNFNEEKDLQYVAGANHWVHASKPKEFLEIMSGYVNEMTAN